MTEADIPLRDQVARCIAEADLWERTVDGPGEADYAAADALLEHFDIRPRGSLPVNEETRRGDQPGG